MSDLTPRHPEMQYLDMLSTLVNKDTTRETRNDSGTRSEFGKQIRFDLRDGFPLLTTKKTHWHSIITELLWFLRGETNVKFLHENGVTIWDEWADANGELGPVYGAQWRNWNGETDQLQTLITNLKNDPYSRRHMVSAWNVSQLKDMALPPCHCLMQFYVGDDGRLNLQLYQRSADIFLGVPFNIASYSALLCIVSSMIGREPGEFVHTFGDYHLYENHIEQAKEQLSRSPRHFPAIAIKHKTTEVLTSGSLDRLVELVPSDFVILGYNPHPAIKAEVSR